MKAAKKIQYHAQTVRTMLLAFILSWPTSSLSSFEKAADLFKMGGENKNEYITYELMMAKLYHSAAVFAKRHLLTGKPVTSLFEQTIERLLLKTGITSFSDLPGKVLSRQGSPSMALTLGMREFDEGRWDQALLSLAKVPPKHRFYMEVLLTRGTILNLQGDLDGASELYRQCREVADQNSDKVQHEKLKRYYGIFEETCRINHGRIQYKLGRYQDAISTYDGIGKTSYLWPYLLLERAWASFHLQNFNRSLGLLVTYKSPLLKSYFFPEAEVLRALSYFRLCLWDDTLRVIEQYYQVYKKRSDELKSVLSSKKSSPDYFFDLMFMNSTERASINPYINNLVTQIRKKVKFNLELVAYKKSLFETEVLQALSPTPLRSILIKEMKASTLYRKKRINHFVKNRIFSFINDIHKYSYELFSIKLELLARKKDLIYKDRQLVSDRSRGDLTHVKRKKDQYYWEFRGAFWADELGDYSFGLKSNCQEVEK